jgi:hypothetical protein|tara:strand:+ start:610 stop:825 length:216 start_codon:yes stop_codon:yes gene_type:complete
MGKNPNQLGANAIWDGPLSEVGRPLAKGNSRSGDTCMQILKSPTPYSPGPITTKTYKSQMSQGISGLSSTK